LVIKDLHLSSKCWHTQCYCFSLRRNAYKETNRENMKITRNIIAGLVGMVVAAGFALSAQATQINGTIGFTSAANTTGGSVVNNGGGSFTLNFSNPMTVNFGNNDYTGTVGATTNFASITFTNGGGLTTPNVPEWTFTVNNITYSFDLLSLSTATFSGGNSSAINLMGEGIAHITGFEDTHAVFALEATGHHLTFDILQPSNTASPAPDGGSTVALLGIALVAVQALRRKLSFSKV